MTHLAEVLGRYSNQAAVGMSVRSVAEAAWTDARDEPWTSPKLTGTTRVRRLLATDLEEMVADYEAGMGCVRLSRKYGVAENTVLERLKRAGVDIRGRGQPPSNEIDEMVVLRAQGWTLRMIGERFGVTRQTVATRLRRCPAMTGFEHGL